MNHWNDLLALILIVSTIYILITVAYIGFTRYTKNKRIDKKYLALVYKIRLFYKPIAWIIAIGGFVALDPLTHGFIIVLVAVFIYKHLGNYVSGLFIRASPLFAIDTMVKAGKIRGKINRIGSLGLILITDQGERWVWFNSFNDTGFTLISNHTNVQQRALYLKSELSKEKLQNLIFDHPILVLGKPIILKSLQTENIYLLHYTLVKGAQHEDFTNFLQEHDVLINSSEKFDS